MGVEDDLVHALAAPAWSDYCKARDRLVAWLEDVEAPQLTKRAWAIARRAVDHPSEQVRESVFAFCIKPIEASLRAGQPFPRELYALVMVCSPYENTADAVIERIPPADRLAIFQREIARSEPVDVARAAKQHLHLAPEATTAILKAFESHGRLREGLTLVRGKKHPVIQTLAKAYGKALGAPPFTFVAGARVTLADVDALDAVSRAQWEGAATAYCGATVKTPAGFVKRLEKDELDASDSEMRRWLVMRGKTRVYDLWVVWVDNGSFFDAGSKKRAPVHLVQGSFEATDATAKDLAADLAASAPKSLWKARPQPAKKSKPKPSAKTKHLTAPSRSPLRSR